MMVGLGFLLASLVFLLFSSALWRQAVKLTIRRIKSSMPISWDDIRAEKDLVRAEYMVKIRDLSVDIADLQETADMRLIEVGKKEIDIQRLKAELRDIRTALAARTSKTYVLERIVQETEPKLKAEISDVRKQLTQRNDQLLAQEKVIKRLKRRNSQLASTGKSQRTEIARLQMVMARNRKNSHIILKEELEELQTEKCQLQEKLAKMSEQLLATHRSERHELPALKSTITRLGDELTRKML
jgi:chromosome segregation ATPase